MAYSPVHLSCSVYSSTQTSFLLLRRNLHFCTLTLTFALPSRAFPQSSVFPQSSSFSSSLCLSVIFSASLPRSPVALVYFSPSHLTPPPTSGSLLRWCLFFPSQHKWVRLAQPCLFRAQHVVGLSVVEWLRTRMAQDLNPCAWFWKPFFIFFHHHGIQFHGSGIYVQHVLHLAIIEIIRATAQHHIKEVIGSLSE